MQKRQLDQYAVLNSPNKLRTIAKPVNDIEDEKKERHGDEKKSVRVNVVWAATFFTGSFQVKHFSLWQSVTLCHFILQIVLTDDLQ